MTVVHEATEDQIDLVAEILADAFQDDPVWLWAVPDRPGRSAILPRFFRVSAGQALAKGKVLFAGPNLGAAVWIRTDGTDQQQDRQEQGDEMPPIYDPYLERLGLLGELLREAHPHGVEHLYLSLIGVRPRARGAGLGGELLTHGFAEQPPLPRTVDDGPAYPAYLEASSERNKALYERHGFRCLGKPIRLPDGPTIHPMWREPEQNAPERQTA